MEVLNVEEKKDLNIENLFYQKIMNVMVALCNGNGQHHMGKFIHVVI